VRIAEQKSGRENMTVLAADYPTTEVPTAPVITPEAWKGADLATSGEWLYRISATAQEELHAALRHVTDSGLAAPFFTREDFPLSGFAAELDGIRNELEGGRGFVVMRGIDRTRYSKRQCADIFWGIGAHLGTAVPQNGDGHLLGHIRDHGYSFDDPTVRGYQTSAELSFHTDMCDAVFLLCLNTAKRGGLNRFVSTVSIHNEILERRPDLLAVLYQPFYFDRRGELDDESGRPYYVMPIFSHLDGNISCRYLRFYIESAQRFPDVPRLTAAQTEALDLLDEIAARPDMHIDVVQEPGDFVLINNYPLFHLRTAFEDHAEPHRKRHLLRQWLSIPNSRRLPETFREKFKHIEPGAIRHGIAVRPHPQPAPPPTDDDLWEDAPRRA
jgi:alpha-ketoglutarate-dependent taurine dioxygenase